MSLTENLSPGLYADTKPRSTGNNVPDIYPTTAKIPPESRRPAMRAVASRARDAEDARLLLDTLGLLHADDTTEAAE